MHILIGIIGIIFFWHLHFCLALTEKYPLAVCWYFISYQLVFAFILLKTTAGITVIGGISEGFNYLLQKLQKGLTSCLADLSL